MRRLLSLVVVAGLLVTAGPSGVAHAATTALVDPLTRRGVSMPLLDLNKITDGVSHTWAGYLRDWDRHLRSGNYPETTRYSYLLSAAQLARYLGEYSPDPDADDAADDPAQVSRAHVESFQAWMVQTRSAATALVKHKALQQFFRWLHEVEQEITRSPLMLLAGGFITAGQVFVARYVEAAVRKSSDPALRNVDVKAFINAAQAEFPAWVRTLIIARFLLATVGSAFILVLLALS